VTQEDNLPTTVNSFTLNMNIVCNFYFTSFSIKLPYLHLPSVTGSVSDPDSESGSGSMVLATKNLKKFTAEKFFFFDKLQFTCY
jgi:hypothetical protein